MITSLSLTKTVFFLLKLNRNSYHVFSSRMKQQKNINDNKLPLIKIYTILYNSTNS